MDTRDTRCENIVVAESESIDMRCIIIGTIGCIAGINGGPAVNYSLEGSLCISMW